MNINMVMVGGRLVRDVEMRTTKDGLAISRVSIAVNKVWKNAAGQKNEYVSYFDLNAFGKTAETFMKYFHKGERIVVEGELTQERWEHEDKETGERSNRSRVTIRVNRFHFIELKEDAAGAPAGEAPPPDSGAPVDEDVPL